VSDFFCSLAKLLFFNILWLDWEDSTKMDEDLCM